MDDADVEVVDEQDDAGSGVGSSDADVVESAVDAQADRAALVDAVVAEGIVINGLPMLLSPAQIFHHSTATMPIA